MNKIKTNQINLSKNTLYFVFVFLFGIIPAFAQNSTTSTTSIVNNNPKINIQIPINKDDYLLYYGLTNDEVINKKIEDTRKDFIDKFKILREEYQKNLKAIQKDKELISIFKEEEIKEKIDLKNDSKKIDSKKLDTKKEIKDQSPKKIILINENSTSSTSTNIIPAEIISIGEKIYTENSSSWFGKVKSLLNLDK